MPLRQRAEDDGAARAAATSAASSARCASVTVRRGARPPAPACRPRAAAARTTRGELADQIGCGDAVGRDRKHVLEARAD